MRNVTIDKFPEKIVSQADESSIEDEVLGNDGVLPIEVIDYLGTPSVSNPGDEDDATPIVDAEAWFIDEKGFIDEAVFVDETAEDLGPRANENRSSASAGEMVRYDPLESYLNEIRHISRLSKEEEYDLALRYKEKQDVAAGYRLVMANLRLVVRIAREYRNNLRNILDIIQEGNLGLLQAVKQFDPYKGVRLPSYAAYWIRAYMLRYLINNIRLVKVGTTQAQRKLFFNLQKEKARLEAAGFYPEAKLLAQRLEVKESEVLEMEQRLALPDLSVDAPVNQDEDSGDYHSILPDFGANAEQVVAREQLTARIREAVSQFKMGISDKERAIVDGRLFTEDPKTLQELADLFGLSRERIRQLETRVKKQLKDFLTEKLGLAVDGEISFD